jgi:hypothetical protein
MAVSTRAGLKQYALRALGAPVLEINVDDDQLEDRIDEALEYFSLYHYEGVERIYLKHKITPSELEITGTNAASFAKGTKVTGATSGAYGYVQTNEDNNIIRISEVIGTFQDGETVSNGEASAVLAASDAYTLGDTENRYITVPDYVYGVTRVVPFTQGSSSKGLFDLQYQLRLNDLYDLTSTSIIYYKTVMSHISLLDLELNGYPLYRFNRMTNQLHIDQNWKTDIPADNYIIVEAYRALDPTTWSKVWNESWLKHYVTALFKKQWATNLKKFQGIQLPGGVTLDGNALYDEAVNELEKLEDDLQNKSAPLDFFLG